MLTLLWKVIECIQNENLEHAKTWMSHPILAVQAAPKTHVVERRGSQKRWGEVRTLNNFSVGRTGS